MCRKGDTGKEKTMKKGDLVMTPRFCTVRIEKVFRSRENALKAGFTEPTHFKDYEYDVVGKSLDLYHMEFAAYKK